MKFQWDDAKRAVNLEKHGFDFADASRISNSPFFVELDDREDYGEDRWIGAGLLEDRAVNHGVHHATGRHRSGDFPPKGDNTRVQSL